MSISFAFRSRGFRLAGWFAGGLAVLAALSLPPAASAATNASDNAGNYTTTTPSSWATGSNGGTGFGAWTISNNNGTTDGNGTSNFAGNFIGDVTANTSGNGNINSSGTTSSNVSFGMYANSGSITPSTAASNVPFSNASRTFGGGALSIGQTFSMQLSLNFRNGQKGFNLVDSVGQAFNFNVGSVGGTDGYYYSVGTGAATNTGFLYEANSVFTLSYTQQSATQGMFTITRTPQAGATADTTTVAVPTTGGATSFALYISGATNQSSDNMFFNNLSVVPEPSAIALVAVGLTGLVVSRRRRR